VAAGGSWQLKRKFEEYFGRIQIKGPACLILDSTEKNPGLFSSVQKSKFEGIHDL
jgi:hypothetical protein